MVNGISREMAKHWFLHCVGCSEASMTTQMRGFGMEKPVYEQAIHAFSGGFLHHGHACGLLTGAAVAAGFRALERFEDESSRSTAALMATMRMADAHPELTGSINCYDITEVSFDTLAGRLRYLREGKGRMCGRLHLRWAPQAHDLVEECFDAFDPEGAPNEYHNCAVAAYQGAAEAVGQDSGNSSIVAGLAGGVGLQGNVCAALAVGVYALAIQHYEEHDGGGRDSKLRGQFDELSGHSRSSAEARLATAFADRFGSEMCAAICERRFESIEAHSDFIQEGGCREVIAFVGDWVGG